MEINEMQKGAFMLKSGMLGIDLTEQEEEEFFDLTDTKDASPSLKEKLRQAGFPTE